MLKGTVQREGSGLSTHLAIKCLTANYCKRGRGIFKGLSWDRGRADFSKKNHRASLFKK
jgi:hypothetical protein